MNPPAKAARNDLDPRPERPRRALDRIPGAGVVAIHLDGAPPARRGPNRPALAGTLAPRPPAPRLAQIRGAPRGHVAHRTAAPLAEADGRAGRACGRRAGAAGAAVRSVPL